MERILKSLPDIIMTALQIGVAYTLSAYSPNEVNYLTEIAYSLYLFIVIWRTIKTILELKSRIKYTSYMRAKHKIAGRII